MLNRGLEEVLKIRSGGKSFVHSLESIRTKAEPLLSKIVETFPDYTTHDIRHSQEVLTNLNLIVPNFLENKLNAYEIYFLIIATYLHDIGMVNFPELVRKELKKSGKRGQLVRNYIRENHHLRSEEFIVRYFQDLAIEDEHQARIIGRICRGHRKENLHNMELFKPDRMYKNYSINVSLLAAFLKIADELDLSFDRAPLIVYEHIPPRDTISKEEWETHLSISGVGLSPEDPSTIKCSATCKNPKIHRALKRLETKINRELQDLPNHLHQYREFRSNLPRDFLVEIEAVDYKSYDFKFSLQEKEIVNLLMGEKLYKQKGESLRELLKNSVDGCRLKRELLKKRGLSYNPEIVFELTPAKDKIIVTDNAMGMDEDIIERYFTRIGESFYRSPAFLEKELDFTPLSELGIGILSCFMIANKIVVETKTDDSDSLLIEIDDVSDYFLVREAKTKNSGTSVTLLLKENIKETIDLKAEIRWYARHLEFPVKIILPNREEFTIEDIGFKLDVRDVLGGYASGYDFHLIEIDDDYIKGVVGILFERDKKLSLKPIISSPYALVDRLKEKRTFVSNEGVFVGHVDIWPGWLEPYLRFVDLDLKRQALDFNVARNDVVRNDKFDKLISRIGIILINGLEGFLSMLERKAKKANLDPSKIFEAFFSRNYIRTWRLKELNEKELSDKLLNLLKRFCYVKCISKDGISYISCDRIVKNSKPVRLLIGLEHYSEEHIRQIFSGCSQLMANNLCLVSEFSLKNLAEYLFKDFRSIDFLKFIAREKSSELVGLIPKRWELARFKNYKTSRLLELVHNGITILNRDNRFIDLLVRNKDTITEDKKIVVEHFFSTLKSDLKVDFQRVITKQKAILKWFVDARLINKDQIENHILTKDDFPSHLFQ